MFVRLREEPYVLWRAVDVLGAELDILLQKRRDMAAAKRFFKRALRSTANSSLSVLTRGIASPSSPGVRLPPEKTRVSCNFTPPIGQRDSASRSAASARNSTKSKTRPELSCSRQKICTFKFGSPSIGT